MFFEINDWSDITRQLLVPNLLFILERHLGCLWKRLKALPLAASLFSHRVQIWTDNSWPNPLEYNVIHHYRSGAEKKPKMIAKQNWQKM